MNELNAINHLNGHSLSGSCSHEIVENLIFKTEGNSEKISLIQEKFGEIMQVLGLDLSDTSLKDTPSRVAAMFVNEIFSGLDPANEPKITLFENSYKYSEMLVEKEIPVYSYCEHHFVPIIGKAAIAYFPEKYVIGLSKLNRIVNYFSKRPQVQEKLTVQIAGYLKDVLQTENVAVRINAKHLCIASRGIEHEGSSVITNSYNGKFMLQEVKNEFNSLVKA